jgi:hypothetical protein
MTNEDKQSEQPPEEPPNASPPAWLRATLADLAGLDCEVPIAASNSADSDVLGDLFRRASGDDDMPSPRVFRMLSAACGMLLRPNEKNDPFGAMMIFADGRRSPVPSDFRGAPIEVLSSVAEKAKHPALRARLGDLCWFLDRKKGKMASSAIAAYVDIVKGVDTGALAFRYDEGGGALKHDARDLLRRALHLARAVGWDNSEALTARALTAELRARAITEGRLIPALWFNELDLQFSVSDPASVGKELEALSGKLAPDTDPHSIVELWRTAARAYHHAKMQDDQHRCQSNAAEQYVLMADAQPMAMMASAMLADAIAELHGVPGKKERRKELRHRLIDAQAGISEEMSSFSHPLNLEDIARQVDQALGRHSLRDKLFVFAALDQSPDPAQLAAEAAQSIREFPLSSLFGASHHDREGKVVHRSSGGGFGDGEDDDAVKTLIARNDGFRRQVTAFGQIEAARQNIMRDHFLSEDAFTHLHAYSAFVPNDLVRTFSRGFLRFFQGDFVSALYILTPLLENSLRHVLKTHGHDVTIFDDAMQTQQDRTISSLFDQMRRELDEIFGAAITGDIERVFLTKPGPYLRHAISHGLLHDGDPYGHDAIYGCWLIFRLCLIPLFPHRAELHLPHDELATASK